MRKKLLSVALTMLFATNIAGCTSQTGEETSSDFQPIVESVEIKQQPEDTHLPESGESVEEEVQTEESMAAETKGLTFEDLSQKRFEFSSGAGAWGEEFTIEKDGSFKGLFHDSDMGDTGEGYENGTYYTCSYSGHFADIVSVNEHTYKMKLADISYSESTDTVKISNNMRYIYTESYCLGGTDAYTIYLPGTPIDEIPAEAYSWLVTMNESEDELTMIAIVDEENGYGIYSIDRPTPLEDAQMTFNTYKQSYDYYKEKLVEAETTLEMVDYTAAMYEIGDDCLNYIWDLIRYNVEEEKFEEILIEQREWISEKESKAKEASAEYEGGSFAAVSYNDTLATLTIERCEELIEYLK